MAYLNKIDINGRTYYLQHLTDGKYEAKLPSLAKDDELLLQSQVINSVISKDSQSGYKVPLSAAQGYSLNAKLSAEEQRALAAEQVLTENLTQEIENREADVNEEQARAEAAEQVLTDNLNKEIQDRINDVDTEEARALAAEKVLTDNLAQEVNDRTNAVTTEQNRATAKENEISTNLTAEINRAKAAEETNATAIATEKSRAEGVESNHESRIATMETFFKEADIDASKEFTDTLKEIQTYIADDKTGAAVMLASIQANKTAIEAEATTARAAEKKNADAIAKKVDKVEGQGLSDQNYTADEKTKLAGIEAGANKYIHPSHTVCTSGLYKITVDEFGHVSSVVSVTKEDIVGLGVPAQDTIYEVAVATTETEDGVDGLLSATDKAKYDNYINMIASLQNEIDELKKLVE